MSRYWLAIAFTGLIIAVVAAAVGYMTPHLLPFTENMLAEGFGLAIAFVLAVLFIEGRSLTQQSRRRKILAKMAKSTLQEASEIGMMLNWELGTWMASVFPTNADLYSGDRGDNWNVDIKPLLQQIYSEAIGLTQLPYENTLSYENFRDWIEEGKSYSQRIRNRIQANLDLHEFLLELVEALDEFDSTLTKCMWQTTVQTEEDRFHALGHLGNGLVQVMEKIGLIFSQLPEDILNERERDRRKLLGRRPNR